MEYSDVTLILKNAVMTIITVSGPILAVALIVGLVIAIFQATTQINEQTLAMVPKILAVFVTLVLLSAWIVTKVSEYATALFEDIIRMIL